MVSRKSDLFYHTYFIFARKKCFVHKKFTITLCKTPFLRLFSLFAALIVASEALVNVYPDIYKHGIRAEA